MSEKYTKLIGLLKELFQLDQPDLDFGLYRIMHAKSGEVTEFLDKDLLPQVRKAFEQYQPADKSRLQAELVEAIELARGLGADPDTMPRVIELRTRLNNVAVDIDALEGEVYDHLYSFFRRYYSEGDFLAKRVYKSGVYAIPYEGEEVMLHWANRDQYYIKTSEYLRDYAFRLRPDDEQRPMRVHFRLVDASEGEHGNIKPSENEDRVFVLAPGGESGLDFIVEEDGELKIGFEYRPAELTDWPEEMRGVKKSPPRQKDLIEFATERVLAVDTNDLQEWIDELSGPHVKTDGETAGYSRLEAHLKRYTARNTFDYFIHKDLATFLRRELDFYIKNEVMHLDDVENETAPRVEQFLSKIKIIRSIAGKIIDFLAQLEDFQKKLWLKKKFVVETNYCITLDRIPEEFYPDIAANAAQREEWVRLFAIDEIGADLIQPGYSEPLTVEFLRAHQYLPIDTVHFDADWVSSLLESFNTDNFNLNGLLIHAENSQALRLLQKQYMGRIGAVYLDPPYNTDAAPIIYKNGYRRSSWTAMMHERLEEIRTLFSPCGVLCITIDDYQRNELDSLVEEIFGRPNVAGTVSIRSNPSGRPRPSGLAQSHEYAIFVKASPWAELGKLPRSERQARRYRNRDDDGQFMWELFRKRGSGSERIDRPTLYYPVYASESSIRVPRMNWNETERLWEVLEPPMENEVFLWPIDENGVERRWRGTWEQIRDNSQDFRVQLNPDGDHVLYYKYRPRSGGVLPTTAWIDAKYSATEHGTGVLRDMFTQYHLFDYPKSIYAVEDCLRVAGIGEETDVAAICLDCFAGSGTTGHAIINLNREDASQHRFILIETESYFDTVLLPRMKKAAYSQTWRSGKPETHSDGVSVLWKYVRLESYEDTLNNLEIRRTSEQQTLWDFVEISAEDAFKEEYMLRYMLDVETRGSQSLLNVGAFTDPTSYTLKIKRPGSDESRDMNVDLLETFNYLIGLTVQHIAAPQVFSAGFERDTENRLQLKDGLKQDEAGAWWFRTVTGVMPDGRTALVIWRKRPGGETVEGIEQDNLVLNEWFRMYGRPSREGGFDLVYVNGDNNLETLKTQEDIWKVRLIEEDFHRLMFDTREL